MNDVDSSYEAHIEDIISSLRDLSGVISKSSENKSHAERAIEILNITSTTIRKSQTERQLILQELINSLCHLSNLYASKKTTKLVLICLEKLMLLTKIVPINSPSTQSVLSLLKKNVAEIENDSALFLKFLQILQSLASPSSLFYSEICLFKQYFGLLCLIYRKSESTNSGEIVTAAFENLILQLVSLYMSRNDLEVYKTIFHCLLSDFISLLGGKDVDFVEMPKIKCFKFILLITNNLARSSIKVDSIANDLFLELLLLYEVLIVEEDVDSDYPLLALKIFKILDKIPVNFVNRSIDLSNKLKGNDFTLSLLFCLLAANHHSLNLEESGSLLLNHFVNKLNSVKFDLSALSIASLDVDTAIESIPATCQAIAGEMETVDDKPVNALDEYIPTICLQGILVILSRYQKISKFFENGKFIFQIFLSQDKSTKLAYSSLELLFLISIENHYIFEFVCNRTLYDKTSAYPLSSMFIIFNELNSPEKRALDLFIRTLVRVIYSLLESSTDISIETLENAINESIFGQQISEFVFSLRSHPLRPQIIEVLNECLIDSVLLKKKFGTEIYLYLLKFAPLEDLVHSVNLLGPECEKYYNCITEKFIHDIFNRIDQSTSSPLLSNDDWESLDKLTFSPFIYDILVKTLESKLEYLDNKEWNCIIEILSKFTSNPVSQMPVGSGKIISLLEQIVDNSDFGTQYMNESFFKCISNCSNLCKLDSQYGILSADNEGFRCVGLIWKVADLIGRDGIASEKLWWSVLFPLIETSRQGSLAVKICAIRSLTTTLVTYWKLFVNCLDEFFREWIDVIESAKDNDELVDRESLFNVSIHETMEIINSVEFESLLSFFSKFLEIVSDSCEINFFLQFVKFALSNGIVARSGKSDLYNDIIKRFLTRVSSSLVAAEDSFNYSDVALQISEVSPSDSEDELKTQLILALAHIVPLLYSPVYSVSLPPIDSISGLDYWMSILEQLSVSLDYSIVIEMSPILENAISDLDSYDASSYIISKYNATIDDSSPKGLYKVTCDRPVRKAAQFLVAPPITLPTDEFNKILTIACKRLAPLLIEECLAKFKTCSNQFVKIVYNLIHNNDDILLTHFCIDKISEYIRIIIFQKSEHEKTLFSKAGILPAPCYLDEVLGSSDRGGGEVGGCGIFKVISSIARWASSDNVSVALHFVLINLLELLLDNSVNDPELPSIYDALDSYMDSPNPEFNIVLLRLFNDSQDPNPRRSAFVTLVKRLNSCLAKGDISPISNVMSSIMEHKIESPDSIGLTNPIFQTFKPHCILPCILTNLYKANEDSNVSNEVKTLYASVNDLIITNLIGSLNKEHLLE